MYALLSAALLGAVDLTGASAVADPLGRGAWFVDASEDAVLLVTPKAGVERFDDCAWPSQVVVDSSGAAYVSCRQAGEVRKLRSGRAPEIWSVGAEPSALALDDDRRKIYVGLATAHEVVLLDADTGRELGRTRVGVEPTALALFGGGLVVGSRKSDVVQIHSRALDAPPLHRRLVVPRIDPEIAVSVSAEQLVPESSRLIIVAPVAEVGNIVQDTYYGSSRGSPVTQELFTLSPTLELKRLRNVVVPDVAAAFPVNGALKMASRGLGGLVSVPLGGGAITMDWDLPQGIVGVARDGDRTFALNDVTREVLLGVPTPHVVQRALVVGRARDTLLAKPVRTVDHIALGGGGDPELARGRALFHQANNAGISDAPLACASCHREGRDDGRTWLGQNSMRQTPMLAGRDIGHTAPYGWNGRYQKLEDYIAFTIRERMLGYGLSKRDLAALTRYVREGLRPVTKPAVPREQLAEVRRGRVVFHSESAGCSSCHGAMDSFTDGAMHEVWPAVPHLGPLLKQVLEVPPATGPVNVTSFGALIALDQQRKLHPSQPKFTTVWVKPRYDTPSLLQLAVSAPYLHDGSAKTLDGVLTRLGDHMGTVSTLTSRERRDLVAYLQTL